MASSVATPLEREFGRIVGGDGDDRAEHTRPDSVTLQFDLSRNIDAAARDVESAINAARSYLPANLPTNPTYRKVNPADAPIMIIALTSDKLPPSALYDAASTVLAAAAVADPGGRSGHGRRQFRAGGAHRFNPTQLHGYGLRLGGRAYRRRRRKPPMRPRGASRMHSERWRSARTIS